MILITGAAGKTGQAILKRLSAQNVLARTLVRNTEQVNLLHQLRATDVVIGDITHADDLHRATIGIDTVYHICPNMHPDEVSIGQKLIDAARANGVQRIVYHSVLHPQTEEMPHHWKKLQVEELLFKSGLAYTILQPAAYMQNVLAYRKTIVDEGVFRVPYAVETSIGMVDLEDVAAAATAVLVDPDHSGAIYELAGAEAWSQTEVAQIMSSQIGQSVRAEMMDRTLWARNARDGGLGEYAVETLLKMFVYYERYGFWGNSKVLEMLLGRKPKSFAQWASEQQWVVKQ